MKLLDKKRIKVKKGEYLAVNERNMLAKVIYMYCVVKMLDILCHMCSKSSISWSSYAYVCVQ